MLHPLAPVFRGLSYIKTWLRKVVSNAMSSLPPSPPCNELLFVNHSRRAESLKTTPSNLLSLLLTQCRATGKDLSKQSRIAKIEYCKSSRQPYHEYLVIYIVYFLDGTSYSQHQSVALVERYANGSADTLDSAPPTPRHVSPPPADRNPGPSFPLHAVGAASDLHTNSTISLGSTSRASQIQPRPDAAHSAGTLSLVSSRYSSSSSDTPADDIINVFPGGMPLLEKKRRPVKAKATMVFKQDTVLSFEQLVCIVAAVHDQAPKYRVASTQCYWFSMCVWAIICEMFKGRIEYDPNEMKPMGKWRRDNGRRPWSYRAVDSNGEGRFIFESEDAKNLTPKCNETWETWRREFANAGTGVMVPVSEIASKDDELLRLRAQVETLKRAVQLTPSS